MIPSHHSDGRYCRSSFVCSITMSRGSTESLCMCPHASWVPILAVFPILLSVSILAAHPCLIHSSVYRLWCPTKAVDTYASSMPVWVVHPCTGVPLYQQCPHGSRLAGLGEKAHPCRFCPCMRQN